MTAGAIEHHVTSSDLVAELDAYAPLEGANVGRWPGLTVYRFTAPTEPRWEEIRALSIGLVAQGSKVVVSDGARFVYDPFNYLVIADGLHFECQILEASPENPCLCFVLEVDPAVVRGVSAEMAEHRSAGAPTSDPQKCVVSALDDEVLSSVLRFLRALSDGDDRRVLAPLYLQELVYRILQREQFARMRHLAQRQLAGNPVGAALTYLSEHLAEPMTVALLAAQVNLSPSAFTRSFREVTGSSPYQFVKDLRLSRARELLVEGRLAVSDVARAVGYASTSHFIKEFRTRFGVTPRDYAAALGFGGRPEVV